MSTVRKANVLVVDAEAVARFGLVHLINSHALLRVAGETDSLTIARDLFSRFRPEIVVVDPALGDGFHFIRDLARSKIRPNIVAFTSLQDALSVQRAFQAGVCGYVTRRDPLAAVMSAISGAVSGERHVGPRAERVLLERLACGAVRMQDDELAALSARERQIFELIGAGHLARVIAADLGVSIKTVQTHAQRIKEKLGLKSAADLQRRAMQATETTVSKIPMENHRLEGLPAAQDTFGGV